MISDVTRPRSFVRLLVATFFFTCEEMKNIMQGLTMSSLRKHPALIPLYICVGAGCVGAMYYTARLAVRCPDVSWDKKNNPEPWQEYKNKQYKFVSNLDYSKMESPAPKF